MKISSVSNNKTVPLSQNNKKTKLSPAFSAIYIEDDVRLGNASLNPVKPKFLNKDALLLNDLASRYPNQDCFIRSDKEYLPRLEFREKPPEVSVFSESYGKIYEQKINPKDKNYPTIPLILHPKSPFIDFIGVPSSMSINPSLPYTIKAGYELHKKVMEKKYLVMDVIGNVDYVDFGEQSVDEKAHEAIDDEETSVTRYLLECAYTAFTNSKASQNFYSENSPKVEARLKAKRRIDLTTPSSKIPVDKYVPEQEDICEITLAEYPNTEDNKRTMCKMLEIMDHFNMFLK